MKPDKGYTEDIPKYKKKSDKPAFRKSDHKHEFKQCYMAYYDKVARAYRFGEVINYCTICGKVGESATLFEKTPDGYFRVLTPEILFSRYGKLPLIFLENRYDKFINIDEFVSTLGCESYKDLDEMIKGEPVN